MQLSLRQQLQQAIIMAALLMGAAALSLAPALAWLPRSVLAATAGPTAAPWMPRVTFGWRKSRPAG